LSAQNKLDLPKTDKAVKLYKKGIENFNKKEYDKGKKIFTKIIEIEPDHIKSYFYLASIAYEENDFPVSEQYYQEALKFDSINQKEIFYSLAFVQQKQMKYDEALRNFEKYIQNPSKNPGLLRKAKTEAEKIRIKLKLQSKNIIFKPVPLNFEINSTDSEYFPVLTGDNQKLIFTRRTKGQEDFFEASFKNGNWSDIKPISEINTPENEGANTITVDGKVMIFTICDRNRTYGSCDLFITKKMNGKWSQIKNMGPALNSEFWDSHPCLSNDGKTLYFASDRPGGNGGKDIWMSKISDNGIWGKPICLDTNINTKYDDFTPFIHADNHTLYFTSIGHEGLGSSDLFMTKFSDGKWSKASNLGSPINTEEHEGGIFITLDGKTAYFCTDRFQAKNKNLDIYTFDVPENMRPDPVSFVKGFVFDATTKELLDAEISIYNNENSNLINTIKTSNDSFLIALPGGMDYNFTINKQAYVFHSERFLLPENKTDLNPYYLSIGLSKIEELSHKTPIVLKNIFFEYNSSELDTIRSASELRNLIKFLKENPEIKIQINGHTDNQGSEEYNLILSEERAKAVYNYLVDKNITHSKLAFLGFGESRPIADNETEENRQLNRRTEFEILK
jgi:outer membrane protein OmpA-like peptidoglycan-associated protein/tetratricopeptide (TPR) repeat protein